MNETEVRTMNHALEEIEVARRLRESFGEKQDSSDGKITRWYKFVSCLREIADDIKYWWAR